MVDEMKVADGLRHFFPLEPSHSIYAMHLIIGVGGPTSSGKTTLAKHLASILSDSHSAPLIIIHQDDFAPLEDNLPWNEEIKGRDWDHPDSAVSNKF